MNQDDRSEWARKFLDPNDIDEITFKSDRFIAFQEHAVTIGIDLSIAEAIRICLLWDSALDGDAPAKKQFLDAINGFVLYLDETLTNMDIDYADEISGVDDDNV